MARIRSIVGGLFVLFLLYMAMGSSRVLTVRNSTGNTSPQWVTRTMVFQSKWLPAVADRDSIVHPDYPTLPDTVVTDTNGTNFKYFPFISNQNSTARADSCRPGNTSYNNRMYLTASGPFIMGGWPVGPYPLTGGGSRYTACWFPLDKLPMDCTITGAKLCFYEGAGSGVTWGTGAGIFAVLDTLKKDERWLTNGNCTGISNPIARKASWDRRVPSGGGADSTWVPRMHKNTAALGEGRDDHFDWGVRSKIYATNLDASGAFSIDVTWPVQAYINRRLIGKPANAGFWIFASHGTSGTAVNLACGPTATRQNNPFLVVSYIKKRYVGPWNGKPLAFVFATDDEDTCNIKFAAILDSLGYKHTMFVRADAIAGSGKMTWAQLRTLRSTYGTDIEPHGLKHLSLAGIAGADSIDKEISRTWLATGLGESDTTAVNFPVYGYPNGSWHNNAITRMLLKGYKGARIASGIGSASYPDTFLHGLAAAPYPVRGDSARSLTVNAKSTLLSIPIVNSGNELWWFGATSTTDSGSTNPAVVPGDWGYRERMDHMINKALYRGSMAMVVFVHGTKGNSTYPNEGVDYDEFSWFMKRLKNRYGDMVWITTMKDLVRFYDSRGNNADPPDFTKSYSDGIRAVDGWYKTKGDVR